MQVGDLVQEWLTDQIGIVVKTRSECDEGIIMVQVHWAKQGLSLWNEYKEWKDIRSLEVLSESR